MSKFYSVLMATLFILASLMPVMAQKTEIQPFIGYRFSDSFAVGPILIGGNPNDDWNEFIAKSGVAYGLTAGYFITPQIQLEFLWSQQDSSAKGRSAQGSETTIAKWCQALSRCGFVT